MQCRHLIESPICADACTTNTRRGVRDRQVAASRGGGSTCATHAGWPRPARLCRRLRRGAAARLPARARVRHARSRTALDRNAAGICRRHARARQMGAPVSPPLAAVRRGGAHGGHRFRLRGGIFVLAAHRRGICRHVEPEFGRCKPLPATGARATVRSRTGRRPHVAVRALQSAGLSARRGWRACDRRSRRNQPVRRSVHARLASDHVCALRVDRLPDLVAVPAATRAARRGTAGSDAARAIPGHRLQAGGALLGGFVCRRAGRQLAHGVVALRALRDVACRRRCLLFLVRPLHGGGAPWPAVPEQW